MARFESGWQILGFLLGAALVSLAVIQVLRVEAKSRYGDDEAQDVQVVQAPEGERTVRETSNLEEDVKETEEENEGFKARMYQHFQSVIDWIKSGPPVERRKRSVSDTLEREPVNPPPVVENVEEELMKPPQIFIDTVVESRDPANPDNSATMDYEDDGLLGQNLVVETLGHHKIRHLGEKIASLKLSDPLVQKILSRFCLDSKGPEEEESRNNVEVFPFDNLSELTLHFPPLLDNKDDEDEPPVVMEAQFFDSDKKFACNSYGDLYLAVGLTTVVNFSLIGIVLLCQTLIRAKRRNKRNVDFFTNNFDELYGKEIFKTSTSEYSPIIKNMSDDYKI